MIIAVLSALCAASNLAAVAAPSSPRPHILFVMADDIGYSDVGFMGSPIFSPTLDALSEEGVRLGEYYVQPSCTPTRSAFFSGRYPINNGMQHLVLFLGENRSLPLEEVLLSERLQEAGYSTHLIGKWHLGHHMWEATPTYRGFDSFVGFYSGAESYYTHTVDGYDFRRDLEIDLAANGTYSSFIFAERACEIASTHDPSIPLFLFLALQNPHSPLQVPEKYHHPYKGMFEGNIYRQVYGALVSALDETVANVTECFMKSGLWENTLFVYTSDNGGPLIGDVFGMGIGSTNWPLRGGKHGVQEGGVRAHGFLRGIFAPICASFVSGFGQVQWWRSPGVKDVKRTGDPKLDGYDMWDSLMGKKESPRKEVLINIDPMWIVDGANGAIRVGEWKLIVGNPGYPDGWFPPLGEKKSLVKVNKPPCSKCTPGMEGWMPAVYKGDRVQLYNLTDDVCERFDLARFNPVKVRELHVRLQHYRSNMVQPENKEEVDPRSNPELRDETPDLPPPKEYMRLRRAARVRALEEAAKSRSKPESKAQHSPQEQKHPAAEKKPSNEPPPPSSSSSSSSRPHPSDEPPPPPQPPSKLTPPHPHSPRSQKGGGHLHLIDVALFVFIVGSLVLALRYRSKFGFGAKSRR